MSAPPCPHCAPTRARAARMQYGSLVKVNADGFEHVIPWAQMSGTVNMLIGHGMDPTDARERAVSDWLKGCE